MNALVWSKDMCPKCDTAKSLLKLKGIQYEERKIGTGWTREQLLESVPTAKSVPQIFLDGVHIGGLEELKKKFEQEQ